MEPDIASTLNYAFACEVRILLPLRCLIESIFVSFFKKINTCLTAALLTPLCYSPYFFV